MMEQDILARAWLLSRDGQGQVLEDWAEPDAEELCEAPGSGHRRPRLRST
jgi:hypothetical protein